jgi:uncharacterized YigZ family protein
MNYFTINKRAKKTYIEKRSKFIAYVFKIEDHDDFKNSLDTIKKYHKKANHHCWAYVCGDKGEVERSSDDGEPRGVAGKNILNQLKSQKLTYSACIVVRYFGGTKLGKSGMIKSYKNATLLAIKKAKTIKKQIYIDYTIEIPYTYHGKVIQLAKRNNINIRFQDLSYVSRFRIEVPLELIEYIDEALKSLMANFTRILPTNQ